MGWLRNKINAWASGKQTEELEQFVRMLRGMDGSELGHVVALATNLRHGMEADGHMPMDPNNYTAQNPTFPLLLSRLVGEAQRQGRMQDAAGLLVWAHTARAGVCLELRSLAREMWRELSRGFPHVREGAAGFERTTGRTLRTQGSGQFPAGFQPLEAKYAKRDANPRPSAGAMPQTTSETGAQSHSGTYKAPIPLILPLFLPVLIERGVPGYEQSGTLLDGEKRLTRSQLRAVLAAAAYLGAMEHAGSLNFDASRVQGSLTQALLAVPDLSSDEKAHAMRLVDSFFECRIIRENHSFDDWLCEVWWSQFQTIPYLYPSAMSGAVAYGLGIRESLKRCTLEY